MIAEIRDTRAGYVINVDTYWIKDGSFLRGRNLLLGYTFPSNVASKLKLSRLRVYGTAQNFFLLVKEAGVTPEQAKQSIETIAAFVKEKFPMLGGAVNQIFKAAK